MAYYRNRWRSSQSYNNSPVAVSPSVKVSDPLLKTRLETLLGNPELQKNTSTVSFMKSLHNQVLSKGYLSQKQIDCIIQQEQKYDPSTLAASQTIQGEWEKEYDENKKNQIRKVSEWYKKQFEAKQQPFYYQRTAEKVLSDPNYVPTRVDYDKMVNNKFSKQYLENCDAVPFFEPGDLVCAAKKFKLAEYHFPCQHGIVISVAPAIRNVKGGHIVTVLATGTAHTFTVEERMLIKYRG